MLRAAWSLCLFLGVTPVFAAEVPVSTSADFLTALGSAAPGDVIRLQAGTYAFNDKIRLTRTLGASTPITITTSGAVGSVVFDVDNSEGFFLTGSDWIIEKVWVRCVAGSTCEGAAGFSIKDTARRITIRNCRTTDWYQHFKASIPGDGSGVGAEDITIQGCESFNSAGFNSNTNAINLDGGKRWRVIGNYVHDFANSGISYGIYFKGGITDSIMEKNLVICDKDRVGAGTAIGMSFGGGRMAVQYCAADNRGTGGCKCEDTGGIARNNIIMRCNDSGFHINSACGSKVYNNLIFATSPGLQIQSMQPGVPAIVFRNNVVTGSVPSSSAQLTASENLTSQTEAAVKAFYADLDQVNLAAGAMGQTLATAAVLPDVTDDYCGNPRGASPFLGPIEFPARCATWPWSGLAMAADAGMDAVPDAGRSPDAGAAADAGASPRGDGGVGADGGVDGPVVASCGCASSPVGVAWLLTAGLALLARRRIH